jgi:hypothetical protein
MNWWMCVARTIRYDFIRSSNHHDFTSRSQLFMADPIHSIMRPSSAARAALVSLPHCSHCPSSRPEA